MCELAGRIANSSRYTASPTIQGDYSGNTGSHNNFNSGNTTYNFPNSQNQPPNVAEILQCLYTSIYQSHLGLIREPVEGTCTWVTEHPGYKEWLGKKTSGLLCLSAGPGCGKSVIAAFLVRHLKLRPDTIVCYFFFKDDSEEQRSPTFALCAILHQLFEQRETLSKYAVKAFQAQGKRFTEEVDTLWDILVQAVADEECGEVICVVDALDECDEGTVARLIRHFTRLLGPQTSNTLLRFLVTGRPYRIEKELGSCATMIQFKGKPEFRCITADVTRVINAGIKDLESRCQGPGGLGSVRELLKSSADGTFLWVSLILEILRVSMDNSRDDITTLVSAPPGDLSELYTSILSRSPDPKKALKLLHIVVGAARPLTLNEVYVAFTIRRDHTTMNDLGDLSQDIERVVKWFCGAFVRIEDSKVYLVHQTAKEFLIKDTSAGRGEYTICPIKSNFILADICMSYLSLQDFEDDPISPNATGAEVRKYSEKYTLLHYAASHWAGHFRDALNLQTDLFEPTRRICESGSNRFLTWLKVYWENSGQYNPFPNDFTHLMIASWLGQGTVVEGLLKEGGDINIRSQGYGTALNVAALRKDRNITKTLMESGVNAYLHRKEYDILRVSSLSVKCDLGNIDNKLKLFCRP